MICDATTFAELAFRPDLDSFWPASVLDLEPEQCWCLPHGAELPCAHCDERVAATPTKERLLCLI